MGTPERDFWGVAVVGFLDEFSYRLRRPVTSAVVQVYDGQEDFERGFGLGFGMDQIADSAVVVIVLPYHRVVGFDALEYGLDRDKPKFSRFVTH